MPKRQSSMTVAALAGVLGAIACALNTSAGDGASRVTLVLRGAVVLLACSVAAIVLLVHPPRNGPAWILAAAACAVSLALVCGVGAAPPADTFGLTPMAALGIVPVLAAALQVGAFLSAIPGPKET